MLGSLTVFHSAATQGIGEELEDEGGVDAAV